MNFLLGKYKIKKRVGRGSFKKECFLVEDEDHNEFVIQRIEKKQLKNESEYYLEDPE